MRQMLSGWKKSEVRAAREEQLARAARADADDASDPNAKKVRRTRTAAAVPSFTAFPLTVNAAACTHWFQPQCTVNRPHCIDQPRILDTFSCPTPSR